MRGTLSSALLIAVSVMLASPLMADPADNTTAQPTSETSAPPAGQPPPIQASFDCTKAKSTVDQLICSDADLAGRDIELAALYRRAKQRASDPDAVEEEQADWVALKRNACRTTKCLFAVYAQRKHELLQWIGP